MAKKPLQPAYQVDKPKVFALYVNVPDDDMCDWCAEDEYGRKFYGSTKAEAEKRRADYTKGK